MLSIVATPIGNLKDITLRALETLEQADLIVCEDTRRTGLLLNHYNLKKRMLVINDYNEAKNLSKIIDELKLGLNVALVSDAGTPLISDPGYKLVRECIKEDIPVDSLPGAASPVVALTLSSLPPDKFMFLGFLPDKKNARLKIFQNIKEISKINSLTYIAFVSPYKLINNLEELKAELGDIEVVLTHELTKIHQSIVKGNISEVLTKLKASNIRGEWILLLNY